MITIWSCLCMNTIPKRYLVTVLAFLGCFSMYALRTTLGIALVDMTSEKTITIGNRTEKLSPEYTWNSVQKGYILSMYAIGHFFTFVCSPVVVQLGGVTTFGIAVILDALINIMTPTFLRINFYSFLSASSVQGLLMGAGTIGVIDTFTHWSPPEERVRLTSYYFTGCFSGVAFGYPLFGLITRSWGWRTIFYVSGGFALIWSTVWMIFVANDPAFDKYITEKERNYLKEKISHITTQKVSIPWVKILKSLPVWALLSEFFSISWCISFLFYCIPLYMKDMYNVDIAHIGFLGALPTICGIIMIPLCAYAADYLRTRVFEVPKVHKIFISFGDAGTVLMLGVIVLGTNALWTIVCFCLIRMLSSCSNTSHATLPIDMAGQFSSVVKAMTLSASAIAQFFNPIVLGYMVPNHTRAEWNLYFLFLTFVSLFGLIMFLSCGSGKLQSWAVVKKTEDDAHKTPEKI